MLALGLGLALVLVGCRDIIDIATTVVTPGASGAWTVSTTGSATAEYAADTIHSVPASGIGSVHLATVDEGDVAAVGTDQYAGKPLADVSGLVYSVRANEGAAPHFELSVAHGETAAVLVSVAPLTFDERYADEGDTCLPFCGPTMCPPVCVPGPCFPICVTSLAAPGDAAVAGAATGGATSLLDDPAVEQAIAAALDHPATAAVLAEAVADPANAAIVEMARADAELGALLAQLPDATPSAGAALVTDVVPVETAAAWQTFDAVGGMWRVAGSPEEPFTLEQYVAAHPEAVIDAAEAGGIRIVADAVPSSSAVDDVRVGVGLVYEPPVGGAPEGTDIVQAEHFDFEPETSDVTVTPSTAAHHGWSLDASGTGAHAQIGSLGDHAPAVVLSTGDGTGTAQAATSALDGSPVHALGQLSFDTFTAAPVIPDAGDVAIADAPVPLAPVAVLTVDTDADGVSDLELRSPQAGVVGGETQTWNLAQQPWWSSTGTVHFLSDLPNATFVATEAGPALRIVAGDLPVTLPPVITEDLDEAPLEEPAPIWQGWTGTVDNVVVGVHADPSTRTAYDFAFDPPASPGSSTTHASTPGEVSADNPVGVRAASPNGGTIGLEVRPVTPSREDGWVVLGQEVVITAPPATPENPLQLRFRLDDSLLPAGVDPASVRVHRNGVPLAPCLDPSRAVAAPDPCVTPVVDENGFIELLAYTSAASVWSFDAALPSVCDVAGPLSYLDVAADDVHAKAIACLTALEIAQGTGADTFAPRGVVSRGQMATFVANVLDHAGVDLPAGEGVFDDLADSPHAANIESLAALGVLAGRGDGTFDEATAVTRGQVATLLVKAFEAATGKALPAAPDRFVDDTGSTHEANINRVAGAGFAHGTGPTTFAPKAELRRNQMASLLVLLVERLAEE